MEQKENPFNANLLDIVRSICGAPIEYIPELGGTESGLITKVAAYTGETDNFPLAQQEPGTLGVWRSKGRGGYGVACVAAHADGEQGYVGILGVTAGTDKLPMSRIVERFGFDQLEGKLITEEALRISPHHPHALTITPDFKIYGISTKSIGKDCVAAYELKKA